MLWKPKKESTAVWWLKLKQLIDSGSKVEYPLWLDWRKYRLVWAVPIEHKEWELDGNDWSMLHVFRDESLLEQQVGKHWDIMNKWKVKARLKICDKKERREWQIEGKRGSDGEMHKEVEQRTAVGKLYNLWQARGLFDKQSSQWREHLWRSFVYQFSLGKNCHDPSQKNKLLWEKRLWGMSQRCWRGH